MTSQADRPPTPSPLSVKAEPWFPALDTLRAVGALAVLTTHVAFFAGVNDDVGYLSRLLARLDVGVAVFFVLSGFLLSRPWMTRARECRPRPATGRYLWKRFLRVTPAYWATVVIALLFIPQNDGMGFTAWLKTLGMAGIYTADPLPHGLTQTWSLTTEVTFYLALPLLMPVLVGRRGVALPRVSLVVGVLVAVNVWWILSLADQVSSAGSPDQWLPGYVFWFLGGIVLAAAEVSPQRLPRLHTGMRQLAANPGSCAVMAAALLLLATTPLAVPATLDPASAQEMVFKRVLYLLVALLLVVPAVFPTQGSRWHAALSHPWARHLGHISYSIFLIHLPLLSGVMAVTGFPLFGGNFLAILALTLVSTLLAAEALYRWVELPAMSLRDLRKRSGQRDPHVIEMDTSTTTTS